MNYKPKKERGISSPTKTDRNFAICRIMDMEEYMTIAKLARWFAIAEERVRQILISNWSLYINSKSRAIPPRGDKK